MSTKKLAKELGLVRQRSQSSDGQKKSLLSNQTFSYLIVIDFESTCWRDKNNYGQEIIEFPAVLLNTSTGEIESEFHTYVQPQEHPVLSEFCTELTGITQTQVEAGIPIQICLSRFNRWLQSLHLEKGVVFPGRQQRSSVPAASQKLCAFVTWSDWDLGVCLQYECKRKQLHKPDVLSSWIDLRSTYRMFYARKPKGLNGALQDLGIQFSGREHSGLDDSRNTAHLAARMMRDGCVMKITRSMTPLSVKPIFGNTSADSKKDGSNTQREENKPLSSNIPPKVCQTKPSSENITKYLVTKENPEPVQESIQSLISPKTLLSDTTGPLHGHTRRSFSAEALPSIPSLVRMNGPPPHNYANSGSSSLVLCSTTMSCLPNHSSRTDATIGLVEDTEGSELSVEIEDRCGSYDDVVLEGDDDGHVYREAGGECDVNYASYFDGEQPADNAHSLPGRVTSIYNARETVTVGNYFKAPETTSESLMASLSAKRTKSQVKVSDHFNGIKQRSEPDCFAVPKARGQITKLNQQKADLKTSLNVQEKSDRSSKHLRTHTPFPFPFRPNQFMPEKTSTPHTSFGKPNKTVNTRHKEIPKSSFSIYNDPTEQIRLSSRGSFSTPRNVLSSISTNTVSSHADRSSVSVATKGSRRITSPLCVCGRRAKRQVVSNGGPNQGRGFFCCPVRSSGSGVRIQKGCEFFKWESAVMVNSSRSAISPAVRSSVSLCNMNSTGSYGSLQRSMGRKSY